MVAVAENIIDGLADLPPERLREVYARAQFLLNPAGVEADSDGPRDGIATADQRLVAAEMELALAGKLGTHKLPVSFLLRGKNGPVFRRGVKALMGFIRSDFGDLKPVDVTRVVRVILGCMVRDMARSNRTVCARTLLYSLGRAVETVDRNFPGYRAAGFLPFVVKRAKM